MTALAVIVGVVIILGIAWSALALAGRADDDAGRRE